MNTNDLTKRQREIFDFIEGFLESNGFPPTVREIGEYFQMASSSSLSHLRAIEKKGFIRRSPHLARNIEIVRRAA